LGCEWLRNAIDCMLDAPFRGIGRSGLVTMETSVGQGD
jgi:hypothetical protein